jgi:hypothetical protein
VDAAPLTVAVYLDGYRYHAAPGTDRLADDADQRAGLRAEGTVVFQLNWDDVNAAAGDNRDGTGGGPLSWHPYQGNAESAARAAYANLRGDPAELPGLIWTTPVRTLFAFLTDPDQAAWGRRAQVAVAGLLRQPGAEAVRTDQPDVAGRVLSSLRGERLRADGDGAITLVRARDASGCPVTVLIDTRQRDPETSPLGTWSAFTVIDDRPATIVGDDLGHERRWAAWLYWGNLIQFLTELGGDGAQLAYTGLDGFDPAVLVAAGGVGLATSILTDSAEISEAELSLLHAVQSVPSSGVGLDTQWRVTYELVTAEVEVLGHELARRGVTAPAPGPGGYELGEAAWLAEIAWPDRRAAVIALGAEAVDCIEAYRSADWDARLPGDWPPDELAALILGGS